MGKRPPPAGNAVPEWVVTYGDLMSLLLCFFILLAAFSELKKPDEFQKVIDAIKEALGAEGGDSSVIDELMLASSPDALPDGRRKKMQKEKSRSDVNEQTTEGSDQTTSTLFRGQRWTIGRPLPFVAASYELTDQNKEDIRTLIAPYIRGSRKKFVVMGHAWGVEDRTGGLSYWELSYRRAQTVVDFLIDECEVDRNLLSLWVAGDTQPVKLEAREGGADAGNRRVDVFMTEVAVDDLHPDPQGTGRGR
ncbi:MAG: OmpA family protein [Phycisphaerales bacterium]|nr:OmpA family protein [Phycisphaerales bacterium]